MQKATSIKVSHGGTVSATLTSHKSLKIMLFTSLDFFVFLFRNISTFHLSKEKVEARHQFLAVFTTGPTVQKSILQDYYIQNIKVGI